MMGDTHASVKGPRTGSKGHDKDGCEITGDIQEIMLSQALQGCLPGEPEKISYF